MIDDRSSSRRTFLKVAGGVAAAGWLARPARASVWDDEVVRILARIQAPVFPKRDFDVTRYGALGDGKTDCGEAIARAIAECTHAGGGRVIFPKGVFFTGPIRLKSNVNLHVPEGVTLKFSRDPKRYLPVVYTRWEGVELMNYSALIYADGEENIAVTGGGILDGQADCEHWWPWKGRINCGYRPGVPLQDDARKRLFDMGAKDVPIEQRVFGEGYYLRPNLVGPVRSKNILIEGVTVKDSPMFEVSPLLCSNVTIRNVNIASHGPNTDGCDPDSCTDVLIENCTFDTGDDCIAIKAGRNRDGRRMARPTENVVIRGCRMKDGHGGLTIGSEMSGGVRNVFAENCRLDSPDLNQALRFKTNAVRGGTIEHIYFRNIEIGQVGEAVLQIDFHYEEGEKGPERPNVHDIDIRNVTCKKSKYALQVRGFKSAPIRDLRLADCTFDNVAEKNIIEYVEGLTSSNVKIDGAAFKAGS
jgi:polygalacturonase